MDIKKLEGSLSTEDFIKGLISHGNYKALGEVWETCVACDHCSQIELCKQFTEEHPEVNCGCGQFIEMLLGHNTISMEEK